MISLLILLISLSSYAVSDIKCEATYDKLGIPHQKVNSLKEFYFCFGYHHARDRGWEMDYFRRVAQGRNAEVYGFSSLKSDLTMRLLDLPSLATRLYEELPELHKSWLISYSEGAKLGFEEGKNVQEFKDLNYTPEAWRPEHSILILVLQSFDQTRKSFVRDYEEEKLKDHWKLKADDLFDEDNAPWLDTILKEGEYPKRKTSQKKTTYIHAAPLKIWSEFPEVFGKESGSNSWVISKEKSKSGYAMLANDPHLDLKTPMFWYWMKLETTEHKIMGATVPGVPVVASGTNGKVAWGLTNAYINTADVVYIKDLKEEDLVSFRPWVDVKLGFFKVPFFLKSFEKTKDGDLILPLELENDQKAVLRWSGFGLQAKDLLPMFEMMKTSTAKEMDVLLTDVGVPAWNYVFADSKGEIGFRVVGQAYKELNKDSYGISNETKSEFKAKELLDPDERPHLLNPERNYIYTANNRHWPLDSKYYGGRAYSYSFRALRINELLKEGKHDVESFKKIQCDRQAVDARFFVKKLLMNLNIPEFKNWNFDTSDGTSAPAIYRRLMDIIMERWQVNEYALFKMLDQLSSKQKDELKAIYKLAIEQVDGRKWSEMHILTFPHLSQNDEWKFSPEIPGHGDTHSVDPGTSKWDPDQNRYNHYSGASMKMIIVLKPEPDIHLALPGLNRDYQSKQDSIPSWREWSSCQYTELNY